LKRVRTWPGPGDEAGLGRREGGEIKAEGIGRQRESGKKTDTFCFRALSPSINPPQHRRWFTHLR